MARRQSSFPVMVRGLVLVGERHRAATGPLMSETPGEIGRLGREFGADTDAVLAAALGYTPQRLDALHARGII